MSVQGCDDAPRHLRRGGVPRYRPVPAGGRAMRKLLHTFACDRVLPDGRLATDWYGLPETSARRQVEIVCHSVQGGPPRVVLESNTERSELDAAEVHAELATPGQYMFSIAAGIGPWLRVTASQAHPLAGFMLSPARLWAIED